jgi:prevent-host-death family protein
MLEVGIFDAKNNISALAERVLAGEEITITRRGQPIMTWVPARKSRLRTPDEIAVMFNRLRQITKGNKLDGVRLEDLAHEGHDR